MKSINLIRRFFHYLIPVYKLLREAHWAFLGKIDPVKLAHIHHKRATGRVLNLTNPIDFNEKVNWLKFNSDTSLWATLADKYQVRRFLVEKNLGEMLNEIYGVYDSVEDIDFALLPESFVLKATNSGGNHGVMVIKDKRLLNIKKTRKTLSQWLDKQIGLHTAEMHYLAIKPRILVEKYLQSNNYGSASLIDYKIHCLDGRPFCVFVCYDRIGTSHKYTLYDINWNAQFDFIPEKHRGSKILPRPESFDNMLKASTVLAKGFPQVRIDWYDIDGRAVFGEMTFTPGGGYISFFTHEYLVKMGNQIDLSKAEKLKWGCK